MNEACAKWEWCSKCSHRVVEVVKSSGVLMGFDRCDVKECGFRHVYPSMDRERMEIGEWCPYYAEAMVEGLNGGMR